MQDVLQEQIAYYRARAAEFDASVRTMAPPPGSDLLLRLGPFERVLELACGTGIWTQMLLSIGREVTALDAAPEMIEQNARKLDSPRVHYQIADLFAWEPMCEYDLVFFAFWLSHVPPDALDAYLQRVRRAVRPGGSLVIVDRAALIPSDELARLDSIRVRRQLVDGRSFTIVTVPCDPDDVARRLGLLGFDVEVVPLGDTWFFLQAQISTAE